MATEQEKEQIKIELLSLTPAQKQILRLRCHNLKMREIADILGISIKGVEDHLSQIYSKLDNLGDKTLSYNVRKMILLRDYCPPLRKILEEQGGIKPPPDKEPEQEKIIPPPDKVKDTTGEITREIVVANPATIDIVREEREIEESGADEEFIKIPPLPPPPGNDKGSGSVPIWFVRRLILIFLAIIIFLLAGFAIIYFFFPPENPPATTQTLEAHAAIAEGIVVAPPTETEPPTPIPRTPQPISPTNTPETPTHTPETPSPTPTETASPTDTLTPTPTPEIIFYDDFSGDLSKWTQLGFPPYYPNHRAVIANEAMTTTDSYGTWVVANIPAETNYKIIINFKGNGCGGSSNYFSPAFIDNSNMIAFVADACQYLWGYTNGRPSLSTYPDTRGANGVGESEVIITVEGKKLSAILNKLDAGSVYNDMYPQGVIAIFIRIGDIIKDVTVIALQE
ncbi:MAG: helix-turn-helix transcriptional regulator [Candidatus Methanosuratincola sp.]